MFRCIENGKDYQNENDGMYSGGDWVSWDWINDQLSPKRIRKPRSPPTVKKILHAVVRAARSYYALTGRYLHIFGELGELYAEATYGIKRHRQSTPGSDGRLGDDLVEVKTISPQKGRLRVKVRRQGNFTKLLMVRISSDFKFESRIADRSVFSTLEKSPQGKAKIAWRSMPKAKPGKATRHAKQTVSESQS
jgi:hypothetical protein